MTNSPEEPADVGPGDVTENPTKPHEDGVERSADPGENPDSAGVAHTAEDAEDDPPLDADEGDPHQDSYPA